MKFLFLSLAFHMDWSDVEARKKPTRTLAQSHETLGFQLNTGRSVPSPCYRINH